jgi:acetyltransferase-like isoleucine patch superfamily enzyme
MLSEIVTTRSDLAAELVFGYDLLSNDEVRARSDQLPRKIVRWLAINHPDGRLRRLLFEASGVEIGADTYINANLVLYDDYAGLVRFGARVAVAHNVTIVASQGPNNSRLGDHPFVREQLAITAPVTIEDDAWLGTGCIILPGVTVGRGAIVGAGAVVTRDVEPYTIVAGIPARVVRRLDAPPEIPG